MKKPLMTVLALAGLLAVTLFVVRPGWSDNTADPALPYLDTKRVAEGRALYGSHCASCHGADLEGEPNWQTPDADGYLPAPPHDETGHTWHHDTALLLRIVGEGTEAVVGGSYQSNMIGFSDVLAEDEIVSVLAYIKASWPKEIQDIHNEIETRSP